MSCLYRLRSPVPNTHRWRDPCDRTDEAERLSLAFRALDMAGAIAREDCGWGCGNGLSLMYGEMGALTAWAQAHRTRVRYLGTTLEGRAVYGATRGPVTRVARSAEPDPHPRTLVWESPLEHLW